MTEVISEEAPVRNALPLRFLGQTGVQTTNLTLGTWGLAEQAYGASEPDALERVVAAALESGIRSFDVAPLWGDGLAEAVVGAAIRERRSECTVVTRAGASRKGDVIVRMFDGPSIQGSLDASRRRLGTDYVDVLLLHEPPEKALFDGSFAKALAILEANAAVRAWGVSTASVEAARIAMSFGAKVLCVPHNLLAPDVLAGMADEAASFDAGVLVRSPLAHGLLTARGVGDVTYGADDHRSRRWSGAALAARRKQAIGFAAAWTQKAPSLEAFALRYALTNPIVASAIVGPRTPEQLSVLIEGVREVDRLDPPLVEKTAQLAAVLGV